LPEPVARKAGTAGSEGAPAQQLPDEIYFSVLQRKAISPIDFTDLDALADRILAFQNRYNRAATPFDWTFTRTDLHALLDRLGPPEQTPTLPAAA
jgi:hypothetical protein